MLSDRPLWFFLCCVLLLCLFLLASGDTEEKPAKKVYGKRVSFRPVSRTTYPGNKGAAMKALGSGGVIVDKPIPAGMTAWQFWIIQVARYEARPIPTNWSIRQLAMIWLYASVLQYEEDPIMSRETWIDLCDTLELTWQFLKPDLQAAVPYSALKGYYDGHVKWATDPIANAVLLGVNEYTQLQIDRQNAKDREQNVSLRREITA